MREKCCLAGIERSNNLQVLRFPPQSTFACRPPIRRNVLLAVDRPPFQFIKRSLHMCDVGKRGSDICRLLSSLPRDLNFNSLMAFPRAVQALPKLKEL